MLLCRLGREICRYYHHHLLQTSRVVSCLATQIDRHPSEELLDDHINSCKWHHFSRVLQGCTEAGSFLTAMLVHAHLIKLDGSGCIPLWNKILNLYCKCRQIQLSHQLFERMPERDIVSFNTMISANMRHDRDPFKALSIYSKMQQDNVKPNHITLSALISGFVSLESSELVELIHGQAIRYGLSSNKFVGSSLGDGYAKQMRLADTMQALNEVAYLDLVSWNILIDACTHNKEHAFRVFSQMLEEGVGFDSFTLTSITKTCSEPRDLGCGLQIHGCAIKSGLVFETPIRNAFVTMYSKCEQGMVSAAKIFRTTLEPNIVSWSALIAGFMKNGQNEEAIKFYKKMLTSGLKENAFIFASTLPVYSSLANLEQGRQVHARIIKSWFGLDISVGNALIDMYIKCGSLAEACLVFTTMENYDVVSCTTMIMGFGQHGKGREALRILETMKNEGLSPDDVTLLGCLSACSHSGLLDEGFQLFRSMADVYGVTPRGEHYTCMVDMFGRAGMLKEAEKFIEDTGIESEVSVWEAMLGACKIHGNMELGERSAKKIMELQPERDGPYVLLANIYADRGLWNYKSDVRGKLNAKGLKKEGGCSWLSLQNLL